MIEYKHWVLKTDDDGIVWLGLDRNDTTVNVINHEVLDELNNVLQVIAQGTAAKGLIIYSGKEKGFIAGADVNAFATFKTPEEAIDFLKKGQRVFARLESLSIPTLAMINGFCMGGGLELALACDYRIATDDSSTKLGLPEIRLGIHPGWGGTVRLPRLIGGFHALANVILTGAALSASKAKKLGIVDDVVPLRVLKPAAVYFIKRKPPRHKPSFLQALSNQTWARSLLSNLFRRKAMQKFPQKNYPAPYAAIDLWDQEWGQGERAYAKEITSVEGLVNKNATASNLIRAFLLQEQLKSLAKHDFPAVKRVHVIGAGVMGGDIAAWCALRGLHVTLQDTTNEKISGAIGRAANLYKKKLHKPRLIQAAMDRLIPDAAGDGVALADVIIEAVFENLEVKQAILQEVESKAKKDAIIASNTSSIPLEEISEGMKDVTRLVGIHFFNPVAKMLLIEVVQGPQTAAKICQQAAQFVNQIGRLPLPVRSTPGFLINRILMPYMLESVQLLEEGYAGGEIDQAARAFGMMMGPVELADAVGLDVCLAVAENLTAHFGGKVPERLYEMVKRGKLGLKTKEGFYHYNQKKKPTDQRLDQYKPNPEIAERLILRMIKESYACLREGVVASGDLLDAGMIFGTGFAPFRGGPIHYAESLGQTALNEMYTKFETKFGERFQLEKN